MKKLNLGNINAGLSTIKELANENAGIARDELIDVSLIDFANKNTYAANDTDDSIRDLADQIETVGLLNPLGVIQSGNRYKLFSGERRYRAITQYLHWDKIPCRIFEGVSAGRAQLMLHIANGGRDYTAEQKLTLYEEYRELLNELKASGEFKGGIQKGVAAPTAQCRNSLPSPKRLILLPERSNSAKHRISQSSEPPKQRSRQ